MKKSLASLKKSLTNFNEAMKLERKEHTSSFVVYVVLRVFVLIMFVLQMYNRNYEHAFFCVLTLILFMIPPFIQVSFKIELPSTLEIIILLFIFAAEILGEINSFYLIFPYWDNMLHVINGFLAAAIGFSLVELLNNHDRFKMDLSPLFIAIVAFCFSMTIGVFWEIFEFSMDTLFGYDMQKDMIVHHITSVALDPTLSNTPITIDGITDVVINGESLGLGGYLDIGLIDTMKDLIINLIGALTFSIFGYFYEIKSNKNSILSNFIPRKKDKDKDFLKIVQETNEDEE